MANTTLTASLVSRSVLAALYNTIVAAGVVFRVGPEDFVGSVNGYGKGDTATIRKPATFTANEHDGSTITVQNATESSVAVVLNKVADVSFELTSKEMTVDGASVPRFSPAAAEAIAQKVDADIIAGAKAAFVAAGNVIGAEAGGAATDPTTIVDAGKLLNDNAVPKSDRHGILCTASEAGFLKDPLFHQADQRGDTDGLREASLGRKFGFDLYASQNAPEADNLFFHRSAIALAMAPLAQPESVNSSVESYKGLSLRTVLDYDMDKKAQVCSIDALYGVKVLDADRGVAQLG